MSPYCIAGIMLWTWPSWSLPTWSLHFAEKIDIYDKHFLNAVQWKYRMPWEKTARNNSKQIKKKSVPGIPCDPAVSSMLPPQWAWVHLWLGNLDSTNCAVWLKQTNKQNKQKQNKETKSVLSSTITGGENKWISMNWSKTYNALEITKITGNWKINRSIQYIKVHIYYHNNNNGYHLLRFCIMSC